MTITTDRLDERDAQILTARIAAMPSEIHDGDYVIFADGVGRRVAHVTPAAWMPEVDSVQTADEGSWYLGDGYVSFSGSLRHGVKRETLTLTDETRMGSCWFFHHDYRRAHNGVDVQIPFRVYRCSMESTS